MWKRKSRNQKAVNLLDLVPEKALNWETETDGRVVVLKPRFEHPLLVKFLLPRMSKPNFRVRLDQYGGSVWHQIDGNNSVRVIGEILRDQFGETIEPVYQRLGLFIRQLEQGRFIRLTGWSEGS